MLKTSHQAELVVRVNDYVSGSFMLKPANKRLKSQRQVLKEPEQRFGEARRMARPARKKIFIPGAPNFEIGPLLGMLP